MNHLVNGDNHTSLIHASSSTNLVSFSKSPSLGEKQSQIQGTIAILVSRCGPQKTMAFYAWGSDLSGHSEQMRFTLQVPSHLCWQKRPNMPSFSEVQALS